MAGQGLRLRLVVGDDRVESVFSLTGFMGRTRAYEPYVPGARETAIRAIWGKSSDVSLALHNLSISVEISVVAQIRFHET